VTRATAATPAGTAAGARRHPPHDGDAPRQPEPATQQQHHHAGRVPVVLALPAQLEAQPQPQRGERHHGPDQRHADGGRLDVVHAILLGTDVTC
jgi:hypothetical protein